MRVGVMMAGLLKKLLQTKQNVDSLSEEEIVDVNTTVATQGRKESKGRAKRGGSKVSKSPGNESQSTSKVRRQSSKSKLPSKDGKHERTGKRLKGKSNASSSKSKSMGSK